MELYSLLWDRDEHRTPGSPQQPISESPHRWPKWADVTPADRWAASRSGSLRHQKPSSFIPIVRFCSLPERRRWHEEVLQFAPRSGTAGGSFLGSFLSGHSRFRRIQVKLPAIVGVAEEHPQRLPAAAAEVDHGAGGWAPCGAASNRAACCEVLHFLQTPHSPAFPSYTLCTASTVNGSYQDLILLYETAQRIYWRIDGNYGIVLH